MDSYNNMNPKYAYDDLDFSQQKIIDAYGVPDSVVENKNKLKEIMNKYWANIREEGSIIRWGENALSPHLFDEKPPGAPSTYPFLMKKKEGMKYDEEDIKDINYMHNLIKMLHNKDPTIGVSLLSEIRNNAMIQHEDPNNMINRKKRIEKYKEDLRRLLDRDKRKITYSIPVEQPSIYIDTRKKTFDEAYYDVKKFIKPTAYFTTDQNNDYHPGTRLQRYHDSLYARAQGMLNKISSKQEAINQYRIRRIQNEWEHYANMFKYDFTRLPPGYDPLPATNCWISKTNLKFLKLDKSYHGQLLKKEWETKDYVYFDPTLIEDEAGYEAWKVWAEKEKKQYAKLCMEEFERPLDWTRENASSMKLKSGPPFKLKELRRFKSELKQQTISKKPKPTTPVITEDYNDTSSDEEAQKQDIDQQRVLERKRIAKQEANKKVDEAIRKATEQKAEEERRAERNAEEQRRAQQKELERKRKAEQERKAQVQAKEKKIIEEKVNDAILNNSKGNTNKESSAIKLEPDFDGKDTTCDNDNLPVECRFTYEKNGKTYYLRTYNKNKEEMKAYHNLLTEMNGRTYTNLMPVTLYEKYTPNENTVTVTDGPTFQFPENFAVPKNDKNMAFYTQEKWGISLLQWVKEEYGYNVENGVLKTLNDQSKLKECTDATLCPLEIESNIIDEIYNGLKNALNEFHEIGNGKFVHRDVKLDNVAIELKGKREFKNLKLFDYDAVIEVKDDKWVEKVNKNQLPMKNGTSLMDRYTTGTQFKQIPKENVKFLDYHQAGMMLLQLGGVFDWVPDYEWKTGKSDFRLTDPSKRTPLRDIIWNTKVIDKNSTKDTNFDKVILKDFWNNILTNNGKINNKQKSIQHARADKFIEIGRGLHEMPERKGKPPPALYRLEARRVWNLSSKFVSRVFNEMFKTDAELKQEQELNNQNTSSVVSPMQFLSQSRQPVFERIQIQSDYDDEEDLNALMEFDPTFDGRELENPSPTSHISDAEFERMLNESTNYDALSEHIMRENKVYSDNSTDMEVEEDAKSISSKHSSASVASVASQMSNVSAQSAVSVASNMSEQSNASTMSNMSHHSYTSNHSVESEEAYPTSEHSEQSYGGYSDLSYNNTSGYSNSSSHSSSESSGKEMGYSNGLSESSDHGMSESSDHESSSESMGYNSSGGSSSHNHSYNSSSDTE